MARTPDVKAFRSWAKENSDGLIDLLIKQFAAGRLAPNLLLQYRRRKKLRWAAREAAPVGPVVQHKPDTTTELDPCKDAIDYMSEPMGMDEFIRRASDGTDVEGTVRIELSELLENVEGIGSLMIEKLVGIEVSGHEDLVEYDFVGTDGTGLYFHVSTTLEPDDVREEV